MAENLVVNGVVYNGVDSISMQNENGEKVPFYPDAVRYNAQTLTEEQKAQARANIGAQEAKTETVLSDNLFDKTTAVTGSLFYHSGEGPSLTTNSNGFYCYVPLRGVGTYRTILYVTLYSESYAKRVPILKEDKTFIQNLTGKLTYIDDKYAYLEFTVTEEMIANGAALYAFSGIASTAYAYNLSNLMIVKDRDYPSEYLPYGYIEVAVDGDASGKTDNVLYGKTAVFLGDSICAGDIEGSDYNGYGWGGLIGEANKMKWTNYGRNGGTVVDIADVQSERWLSNQANKAIAEHPEADYVIFDGGGNDADQLKEAGLGVISSDYATFDTSTFSGALESLILKLVTAYPNAKIGYIVPQKMYTGYADFTAANHIHRKYFDRAVEICQKWGIPVVDIWNGSMLNPKLSTASVYYSDGIQHLTEAGYLAITPMIEAWMRNMYVPGIVGGGSGGGNSAPADWNAAEGQPGYIANRTHWSEYANVKLYDNITVNVEDEAPFPSSALVPGQTYTIVWDGVEYTDVAISVDMGGMIVVLLGSGFIIGDDSHNPDLPYSFLYMEDFGGCMITIMDERESVTVTLSTYQETVEKIPQKYLPETKTGTFFIECILSGTTNYFVVTTPEKLKEAEESGRNIVLKITAALTDLTMIIFANLSTILTANNETAYEFVNTELRNRYIITTAENGYLTCEQKESLG